jgi:excinuclease ABC subunit C
LKGVFYNLIKDSPTLPGVYRMIDEYSNILYVGKAKNLNKRLLSYTRDNLGLRIDRMISQVKKVEIVVTKTELEAILLELKLIKTLKPKYNILLRDDKTFPYLKISTNHNFPGIYKYRTKNPNLEQKTFKLFGPFASSIHLDSVMREVSKIFMLRTCQDNYFKFRKRPCVQYQIKRCSGSCVSKINSQEYNSSVSDAIKFLSGKNSDLLDELNKKMLDLSSEMRYEEAARIRDRILAVNQLKLKHDLELTDIIDADIFGVHRSSDELYCIQIFVYRGGQFFGNRIYFICESDEVFDIESLLIQFYQTNDLPKEIIIGEEFDFDHKSLEHNLKEISKANDSSKIKIVIPKSGSKLKVLNYVKYNAKIALEEKIKKDEKNREKLRKIQEIFKLDCLPRRIEFYDNSHIMGKYPVGAMVVLVDGVLKRSEYRIYKIKTTNQDKIGGDDYQMLREVLTRRIKKILEGKSYVPDLIIIDGGQGHLNVGISVAKTLNVKLNIASMAKGEFRDKGGERFFTDKGQEFTLSNRESVMQMLQVARDAVHNYAIETHRKLRDRIED